MFRALITSCTAFFLLLLAASTVSTKAAGAFWLSLFFIGVYGWIKSTQAEYLAPTNPEQNPLARIAKGWLIFCLLGLALKSIPMVYWSGPWQDRHAELRLLIGSLGSYLLIRHSRLPQGWFKGAGHSLGVACVSALLLAAIWGSSAAPTNRIPWAAGLSVLSCLLLTWSFSLSLSKTVAGLWGVCSLLGVCAVLISGVRGSYLLLLVWPALWWTLTLHAGKTKLSGQLVKAMLALAVALAAISLAPRAESPLSRVKEVVTELGLTSASSGIAPNSSNGARMVLWKAGLSAFKNHWFLGLGSTGGKELIQQAAQESQSETVSTLGNRVEQNMLAIQMDIPLFNGFATQAQTEKAAASLNQQHADYNKTNAQVLRDTQAAQRQQNSATHLWKAYTQADHAATQQQLAVETAIKHQLATPLDLAKAKEKLTELKTKKMEHLLAANKAYLLVYELTGKLNIESALERLSKRE